jgi:HSP20 family protein
VRAALPGVKAEDVQVQVEDGQLSIRAEMHAEEERQERGYLMREIRRGTFARTIPLPVPVQADKAEARLEQGILELVLPKAEKAKAKSIKVVAK